MPRVFLTNGQKLTILCDLDERTANGKSLKAVAKSHGVQPVQIQNWRKVQAKLQAAPKRNRSLATGQKSSITYLEDAIIGWHFEMRQAGLAMSYRRLMIKASAVDADFRAKKKQSQYQLIRRLCAANELVYRKVTHQAQTRTEESLEEAKEWLLEVRPILQAPNVEKTYVINMDQTPLPFSLADKKTLDMRGVDTVSILSSGNPKTRCTISLTVCADGTKLKPMVIFKGEPDGTIATRELATSKFKEDIALCAHPAAYQDTNNLNQWVDDCLVPHIQQRAVGTTYFVFRQVQISCCGGFSTQDGGIGHPIKAHSQQLHLVCPTH